MKCFSIFHSKSTHPRDQKSKSAAKAVKSTGSISSPRSIPELYKEKEHNLKKFSFSELRNATTNFNKLLKIGEGGFGSVYKARIRLSESQNDPLVVAIKRLNKQGMQGHKEWLTEIQFLGVVDHPNLVKLLGYCSVDGERVMQRLLVYEYMPNKSLAVHLFSTTLPPIPWKTRLRILLGAAEGLAYLHEGLEIQVIYRDFKSSNVLLDEKFNAKLSDLGLAREGPQGDCTHVSTLPVGTYGYAAPEYIETGHLKSKSDVWSFGVVLFEVLTGRPTVDRKLPKAEQKLIEWVKQFPPNSRKFWMVMDRRLNNQYSLDAARSIAKLAVSCLYKNPNDRPTMSQIVKGLKNTIKESESGLIVPEKRSPVSKSST
ncbi:probable serine/threonine-protein kinase PBL19 [Cynara cardunculus var. scolymus]|uniref:probable serine/threonine-protein kinase PBL19 n=1 Tax=Cynara cardunculus var. scolymus TaxID=59895 RepID=UPI000D62C1B7|nr:probable serine/threonine-protein kinase PBL19 [Cynara cardunculus var. scolymus]